MAEFVLDANVLVAYLYDGDSQHERARRLIERIEEEHDCVLVDFLVYETLSVLCRRANERKINPPDLQKVVAEIRGWFDRGEVRFLAREAERFTTELLDVVAESGGLLNSNDALVVVLEREGAIDNFVSFDSGFDQVEGFQRIS